MQEAAQQTRRAYRFDRLLAPRNQPSTVTQQQGNAFAEVRVDRSDSRILIRSDSQPLGRSIADSIATARFQRGSSTQSLAFLRVRPRGALQATPNQLAVDRPTQVTRLGSGECPDAFERTKLLYADLPNREKTSNFDSPIVR